MSSKVKYKKFPIGNYSAYLIESGQPDRPIATIVKAASGEKGFFDVFWVTGRVDRDCSLEEAKDTCSKGRDVALQISKVGCTPAAAWWAKAWSDARAAVSPELLPKLGLVGADLAKSKAMFHVSGSHRWIPISIAEPAKACS